MPVRAPRLLPIAAACMLAACADVAPPLAPTQASPPLAGDPTAARTTSRPTGTGIGVIGTRVERTHQRVEYHGGAMMYGPTSVYLIWYGSWTGSSAPTILADLAQNIGGSRYFDVVSRYRNDAGVAPGNAIVYSGSVVDAYSYGSTLTSFDVASIVGSTIIDGALPLDPDAVYVVLTSADVSETSGFGTAYCGLHNRTSVNSVPVQYVFIGHPDRAPAECEPQSTGPNGDAAADAMANVFANELFDAIVDPAFTAWYDRFLLEPADKCAWSFGTTYSATNGASANVHLGTRDFLLQQQWVPGTRGFCTLDVNAAS